jgi:hypothetical protein
MDFPAGPQFDKIADLAAHVAAVLDAALESGSCPSTGSNSSLGKASKRWARTIISTGRLWRNPPLFSARRISPVSIP